MKQSNQVTTANPFTDDNNPTTANSLNQHLPSQLMLSEQLNKLCHELNSVDARLTDAARLLCIAGKQTKPQLKQQINSTLQQLQLSFNFVETNSLLQDASNDSEFDDDA